MFTWALASELERNTVCSFHVVITSSPDIKKQVSHLTCDNFFAFSRYWKEKVAVSLGLASNWAAVMSSNATIKTL